MQGVGVWGFRAEGFGDLGLRVLDSTLHHNYNLAPRQPLFFTKMHVRSGLWRVGFQVLRLFWAWRLLEHVEAFQTLPPKS